MNRSSNNNPELEIIKFLYQFKDDNKFYKLEEHVLNTQSQKEKYTSIYTLRDNALIATDREVYLAENGVEHFKGSDDIKAKILPKGIVAVESMLQNQ